MECQTQRLQDQVAELQERLAAAETSLEFLREFVADLRRQRDSCMVQRRDAPWLPDLLQALGWEGGTIHQALRAVHRMRAALGSPEALCFEPSQRDAAIEQLKDAVTDQRCQVAELQERLDILRQCVDDVMGHGVTLGAAYMASEEFQAGYTRGVDSQRSIAREALKELAALGDSRESRDALQEENARLRAHLANAEGPMALLDVLRDAFAGVEFGDGTSGNPHRHEFHLTLEQAAALRAALGDSR